MKEKTAIEVLVNCITSGRDFEFTETKCGCMMLSKNGIMDSIFEYEKQQIISAFKGAKRFMDDAGCSDDEISKMAEQYYAENYGGDK